MYKINKEKSILPKTKLVYDIQYVPKDDSFHANKRGRFEGFLKKFCVYNEELQKNVFSLLTS